MPTNTYVALSTQTLASPAASITFSSIPSGYTDLVFVIAGGCSTGSQNAIIEFNSDTTNSNYSTTILYGTGSAAGSARNTGSTGNYFGITDTTIGNNMIYSIQNYSNTTTFKTMIGRANGPGSGASQVRADVLLWRSTAAINRINLRLNSGANWITGTTVSLYGISAVSTVASSTPPVSGYNLWLDASDAATITQSSNLITQWNDKSGSGNNFTASGALRPSYVNNYLQNGLNTVLFSGSQGMTTPSLPWASGAFTVFSVAKIATASGYPGILETVASAGTGIGVSGGSGYYSLFKARIAPNDFSSNAPFSTSNADLLVVKSAGMSGGAITATGYKNGTSIGTASFSGGATASAASIGYDGNVGDFANMNFCELLIYPSQLSDPNRVLVENYLKSKWGIA